MIELQYFLFMLLILYFFSSVPIFIYHFFIFIIAMIIHIIQINFLTQLIIN